MSSLILIPTFNEVKNLGQLLGTLIEICPPTAEFLIIDDHSPDGTGLLAEQCSKKNPKIHVLHRAKKMGLGPAYLAGFEWGLNRAYHSFIQMDADLSHQPHYLPLLFDLLKNYPVIVGSRYLPEGGVSNWPIWRQLLSRLGNQYARFFLGNTLQDFTGGFNGWQRIVLETIDLSSLKSDGYAFQIELKYRALLKGFKIQEFPIVFLERNQGRSKMNWSVILEALLKVIQFRYTL